MTPLVKKIILTGLWIAAVLSCLAWEPPKMQCLKLMNNNQRIKLAWSSNGDCIHFKAYYFYINNVLCDSLFGYSSATQNYTLCDYGCFPIWHPEADLWMMNLESGETFPLEHANSADAESFHNWSLNSKWIVFTSRRDDGLYTRLYLAHIDKDGHASKAFCLPQRNPQEYDAETVWAFNTPEFASAPIRLDRKALQQNILGGLRSETSGKPKGSD